MIAFDPLPNADDYIEEVFQISEEDGLEIEGNFPQLGYESTDFLMNYGSLVFITAF